MNKYVNIFACSVQQLFCVVSRSYLCYWIGCQDFVFNSCLICRFAHNSKVPHSVSSRHRFTSSRFTADYDRLVLVVSEKEKGDINKVRTTVSWSITWDLLGQLLTRFHFNDHQDINACTHSTQPYSCGQVMSWQFGAFNYFFGLFFFQGGMIMFNEFKKQKQKNPTIIRRILKWVWLFSNPHRVK